MIRLIAIADDLSGAAETAAHFLPYSARTAQDCTGRSTSQTPAGTVRVLLVPNKVGDLDLGDPFAQFVVLDTDNRSFGEPDASRRLGAVLSRVPGPGSDPELIFLKVDSLLRGHLASQLRVLTLRGPVIFAGAIPALARSTVNGVVHSAGVPLHRTTLWSAEGKAAPETIAAALAPLATRVIDLQTVRGDSDGLARVIAALAEQDVIALCDAETSEDLDAIAEAGLCHPGAQFAGASALGAALGKALIRHGLDDVPGHPGFAGQSSYLDGPTPADAGFAHATASTAVLLVVGTASAQSRTQLDTLSSVGVPVLSFSRADLLAGTADPATVRAALVAGTAAICIDGGTIEPETSARLAVALASFAATIGHGHRMALTGGETARAVLDFLGVRWLEPLAEVEHGAVVSRTDQNALIVTRPGSFGGADSLLTIVERLSSYPLSEAAFAPSGPGKENP